MPLHSQRRQRRARRRALALLAVLVLSVAAVVAVVETNGGATRGAGKSAAAETGPAKSNSAQTGSARSSPAPGSPTNPATLIRTLGAAGVTSSTIIAENERPGTTDWHLSAGAAKAGTIAGFADMTYAAAGQTVQLYVTTAAPTFHAVAYRMGWYQGQGARQIWSSPEVTGRVQPPCTLTAGVNMVSCDNWSVSLSIPITASFVQGDYLIKLVGSGNQQSYIPLTIWDPRSTATYLFVSRSLTEEGWNVYGGYSYYEGLGPCTLGQTGSYPPCNRARIVSFDRPYAAGNGASDFLSNEYPLLQLMEQHGLDVAYVSDITLDADPSTILQHKALLSLGHDETWTYNELQGAETALRHGINLVFFSAAAVVRHARLEPSALGPDRREVDYRDQTEDPLNGVGNPMQVTGNTWSSPPANWSEIGFTGELYSGYLSPGSSAPFVVAQANAWIFKGTGLQNGSQLPGVIGSDIDHLYDPVPANIEVLGHSPVPLSLAYTNQGKWGRNTYSDMTYYTDQVSGAGVWDSGTVNWINALATSQPLATITTNLLWLFGQGPAGDLIPSVPNWQSIEPPGS
jgi:hypothetical protein